MKVDMYTAAGAKKGSMDLPASMFEVEINEGLMHQAIVRQQSNRRQSIAHSKSRGEVSGSTRKLYKQKGTGNARRGQIRSSVVRGGHKAFGPRNNSNYIKDMPKKMRRNALKSCLSYQAKAGKILGLENYTDTISTKAFHQLLEKLPVDIGRHILFVLPEEQRALKLSAQNVENVKSIHVQYLNPEDILKARHLIFVGDAAKKSVDIFAS